MDRPNLKIKAKVSHGHSPSPSASSIRPPPSVARSPSPTKLFGAAGPPNISTFRPKAKVNTTATPNVRKGPKATSTVNSPVSLAKPSYGSVLKPSSANTSRSASPVRRPQVSPTTKGAAVVKARPTVRANLTPTIPQSTPTTPLLARRPSSPAISEANRRLRTSSISETRLSSPLTSSPPENNAPRIRSKVTEMARQHDALSVSPLPAQLSAPRFLTGPRIRATSITSSVSLGSGVGNSHPEPTFYPITTATPAANPHRYSGISRSSTPRTSRSQLFRDHNDDDHTYTRTSFTNTKAIDPTRVPLPTHSPTASAVSFSSRSTTSHSSSKFSVDIHSSPPTVHHQPTGIKPRDSGARLANAIEGLMQFSQQEDDVSGDSSLGTDDEPNDELTKVRAQAKSNRKIEDLEISNRSLLAINTSLEAAKHKQAKEIRDLRRRLRESRLILPPQAYRAIASTEDLEDEEEDTDEDETEEITEDTRDESYQRVRMLIEELIQTGKKALEAKPADFLLLEANNLGQGAKVLHAEEIRDWESSAGDTSFTSANGQLSPSLVAVPDDDFSDSEDYNSSEEEVEGMLSMSMSRTPSPLPPILISEST